MTFFLSETTDSFSVLVGGVKIRDIAVEFAGAGVDHLVHRADVAALAQGKHLPFRGRSRVCAIAWSEKPIFFA